MIFSHRFESSLDQLLNNDDTRFPLSDSLLVDAASQSPIATHEEIGAWISHAGLTGGVFRSLVGVISRVIERLQVAIGFLGTEMLLLLSKLAPATCRVAACRLQF